MRFQLPTIALLSLALLTSTLAQDAGVSSIVSEIDSIKSEIYALSTETNNAVAASSLGSVLASYVFLLLSGDKELGRMFKEIDGWKAGLPEPPWAG